MFAFLVSILCGIKGPGMTDEDLGSSHFVLIRQVAQVLSQQFNSISRHSSPVRPSGRAQGFVSVT